MGCACSVSDAGAGSIFCHKYGNNEDFVYHLQVIRIRLERTVRYVMYAVSMKYCVMYAVSMNAVGIFTQPQNLLDVWYCAVPCVDV